MAARGPTCFVCGQGSVKYRFPCCRERYCSLTCYQQHAVSQCPGRKIAEGPDVKRRRVEEDRVEDDHLLSEVQLCALRGHQGLRQALRSEEFRDVLRKLDGARNRQRALELLIQEDAFFVKFVEQCIEAIDFAPE
mmetsp:Transcript_56606/g.104778  ORF Transcript_56606/g.104778 Transcript_56606/m.104778 type:complete len:135 (+) Transcript_56606:66-470(+)